MLKAIIRHAATMKIVCMVCFLLGLSVTSIGVSVVFDYADGHVDKAAQWTSASAPMALNTAWSFLLTGLAVMGLAGSGEHLLQRLERRESAQRLES